jgi:hypothetical protein
MPEYARTYDPGGNEWDPEALEQLDAEQWAEWIRLRISGRDRWFPYGRGDSANEAALIFRDVARACYHDAEVDLPHAREGVRRVISEHDPREHSRNTTTTLMYVAEYLARPETDEGAEVVARWIRDGVLLGGSPEEDDHRFNIMALFCLGLLQPRGDGKYMDIWDGYFQKKPELDNPYFYVTAGFTGKVLSAPNIDCAGVIRFVRMYTEAKADDQHFPASAGLRAFWDRWDAGPRAKGQLVDVFEDEPDGAALWDILRSLTAAPPEMGSFEYEKSTNVPVTTESTAGSWHSPLVAAA